MLPDNMALTEKQEALPMRTTQTIVHGDVYLPGSVRDMLAYVRLITKMGAQDD